MGYYTRYTISIESPDGQEDDIIARLSEVSDYSLRIGLQDDTIKWYDHKENTIKVSLEFPNATIYLEGEGEEHGDAWKAKVSNGKYMRAKGEIVFGEYKEV